MKVYHATGNPPPSVAQACVAFRLPLVILMHTGSCCPRAHGSAQASTILMHTVLLSSHAQFCCPRAHSSVILACMVLLSSRAQFCSPHANAIVKVDTSERVKPCCTGGTGHIQEGV